MSIADEYRDVQRRMQEQGVIFSFVGYVSEGILFSLGEALRQKMRLDATDPNVIKRVFSIFIEQVQNVIRYSSERIQIDSGVPSELSPGLVTVGRQGDRFFVVCGNVVGLAEGQALCARLAELAQMDPAAIKTYYREKLREPSEPDSRGANLGLIEIARRSSRPIEFGLAQLNEDRAFFCLKAYI